MSRTGNSADAVPGQWAILALLALTQVLAMSPWFTASATSAQLAPRLGLAAGDAAFLTTAVQLGFVAGTATAALLNLADIFPARRYLAVSATLAALAGAALLAANSLATAAASRLLTGFFLAGVYPPAMKMAATWFRARRGLAIGTVVGALTLGKALPYLVSAIAPLGVDTVVLSTSAAALLAAVLVVALYRDGPFAFPRRSFSWSLVRTIAAHRPTRLAIAGYLGHMWELYAMWALIALFFRDAFVGRGYGTLQATSYGAFVAFSAIAAGALGSVLAGAWADRLGRERVASGAMVLSGLCALVIGWVATAPLPLLIALALVWGCAIVADSAQFSALVTEVAPEHAVGTALTLQTSLGFALTALSIWLTAELAAAVGWGIAFSLLAAGPALGILAMFRLRSLRAPPSSTPLL